MPQRSFFTCSIVIVRFKLTQMILRVALILKCLRKTLYAKYD